MHADDAVRCAALGVDGVMVSNHGGRQLDRSPAPIEVLPAIVEAVGDKLTVMLDGGIRRGSDAVVALCLGAKYVFVGRATLYGAAAGGTAGATRALAIFKDEIGRTMMQMGAPDIRSLGPQFLTWHSDEQRRNAPPSADEGARVVAPEPAIRTRACRPASRPLRATACRGTGRGRSRGGRSWPRRHPAAARARSSDRRCP